VYHHSFAWQLLFLFGVDSSAMIVFKWIAENRSNNL
jgi:hypothetical protein